MSRNKTADSREREFEDALLAQMAAMPYNDITVTHLIKAVGVTRKTFYLHFANKDTCLISLMDRLILEQNALIDRQPVVSPEHYISHFTYWRENPVFLKCVIRDNLFQLFLERLVYHIQSEEREAVQLLYQSLSDPRYNYDPLIFFSAGYLALLLSWASNDYDTPVESMAEELYRLLHTPLFPT